MDDGDIESDLPLVERVRRKKDLPLKSGTIGKAFGAVSLSASGSSILTNKASTKFSTSGDQEDLELFQCPGDKLTDPEIASSPISAQYTGSVCSDILNKNTIWLTTDSLSGTNSELNERSVACDTVSHCTVANESALKTTSFGHTIGTTSEQSESPRTEDNTNTIKGAEASLKRNVFPRPSESPAGMDDDDYRFYILACFEERELKTLEEYHKLPRKEPLRIKRMDPNSPRIKQLYRQQQRVLESPRYRKTVQKVDEDRIQNHKCADVMAKVRTGFYEAPTAFLSDDSTAVMIPGRNSQLSGDDSDVTIEESGTSEDTVADIVLDNGQPREDFSTGPRKLRNLELSSSADISKQPQLRGPRSLEHQLRFTEFYVPNGSPGRDKMYSHQSAQREIWHNSSLFDDVFPELGAANQHNIIDDDDDFIASSSSSAEHSWTANNNKPKRGQKTYQSQNKKEKVILL